MNSKYKNYCTYSYLLSALILVVMLVAGQVFIQYKLTSLSNDAQTISRASKQSVLSQHIAKTAVLTFNAQDADLRETYIEDLNQSLKELDEINYVLRGGKSVSGLIVNNSPKIDEMFLKIEPELQALKTSTRDLINNLTGESVLESAAQNDLKELLDNEKVFLSKMRAIVGEYSSEAELHLVKFRELEIVIFCILILTIILQIVFIFRPVDRALKDSILSSEEEKTLLQTEISEILQSSKLKTELLASVSHEVRTPLNGIMGMSTLLLDDTSLNEAQLDYVTTINSSAESALTIVNDVLDLSGIEEGKIILEPTQFNLRTLIEDSIESLSLKAEEKDVELVFSYHTDLPHFFVGDPRRLRQVLSSLIAQMINNTSNQEILIHLSIRESEEYKTDLHFMISDIGFNSLDNQTDMSHSEEQLRSIGLTVTSRLIELMKGELKVESNPGLGSIYSLNLKLPIDYESSQEALLNGLEPLRYTKVLIVDNNQTRRQILQNQLASWLFKANGSPSAESALNQIKQAAIEGKPYKVVIINSELPDSNGEILAEKIKAEPELLNTSLILVLPLSKRGEASRNVSKNFIGCLVKPIRISKLVEVFKKGILTQQRDSIIEVINTKLNILVVEDNLVSQKVAVSMLQKLGCQVDTALNGRKALECLKHKKYDLIFMDCQMPEMDGYQATQEIRCFEGTEKQIPIVAMTAGVLQRDKDKCVQAGMDGYIGKPIKFEEVKDVLRFFTDKDLLRDSSSKPSFDLKFLGGIKQNADMDLLRDFVKTTPDALSSIGKAIQEGEIKDIKFTAKNLKEECQNIGASRMAELCDQFNLLSDLASINKAVLLINKLNYEFKKIKEEIEVKKHNVG